MVRRDYKKYEEEHKHPCPECGALIYRRAKFCLKHRQRPPRGENSPNWRGGSKKAQERYRTNKHKCIDCGKLITINAQRCRRCHRKNMRHPHWNGGRIILESGYVCILKHGHPRANTSGYVREHILVWEEAHGKPVSKGWIIHHLNGIRDDNRPENLIAVTRKNHEGNTFIKALHARIRKLEQLHLNL